MCGSKVKFHFLCVNRSAEFADIGCMLEIEDVQHLPDGRSIIKTHGGRRFRVNSRGMRDGYNTAKVEFVSDDDIAGKI